MRVGVNYAWKNYGWDFGPTPQNDDGSSWQPRAQWRETVDADLDGFRQLGLFAVRWFLLCDGLTWGSGAQRPHIDPERGTWRFDDPPPLSEGFLEDFRHLLDRVRAHGLQLLPSTVDFKMLQPGQPVSNASAFVKQGRADIVTDPWKRQRFFDGVLTPLLQAAAPYRDVIYAWELINEPEWSTRGSGIGREFFNDDKTVSGEDMITFLREGAGRINGAGFRSTAGLAYQTLARWGTPHLGFTLHQFHYYGNPREVPPNNFDPRWPLIVGEIATAPNRPWAELGQDQDVYQRLKLLERKGYADAFLWSSDLSSVKETQEPAVVDWSERTRELVRRYTSGG